MSDVRAEPLPEQPSPSPDRTDAAPRPDPLAGDWSEGLPGPLRAHGLPLPARLGDPRAMAGAVSEPTAPLQARDPGWTMAPPAPQPAVAPAWAPHAHDAGFAPVTAAADAVTVSASEPETWQESKDASPWAAAAQPVGDWDATGAAAATTVEHWAEIPAAEPTQEWPAPQAVADDEAAMLLRPVVDDREASTLLRPVDEAANDAPSEATISFLHPPGDLDPALQPIMDPTLLPMADGESVVLLNPHDHPDLPAPVNDDAPPMASGSTARGDAVVAGEHRVAIHTRGGRTRRGSVTDLDLAKPQFALQPQGGGSTELVPHAEVKAIFFMLAPGEPPTAPDGGKVRVTFSDGRSIEGHRDGADPPQGFFLVPLDAQKTNTKRIYVSRAAVATMVELA
ncbi:MAG: DUF6982 domain-containing protein [Myxococcales bacterium]